MKMLSGCKEDIERIQSFMKNFRLSGEEISHMAGISPTTTRELLKFNYAGDVKGSIEKLLAVVDRETEKSKLPEDKPTFVLTTLCRRANDLFKIAHLQGFIGIGYGDSGTGKSWATQNYVSQHKDSLLIECHLNFTPCILFGKLNAAIGNYELGNLRQLFDAVVSELSKSGRLIVIDEAENLPYASLEMLRRALDFTGCGCVLIGLPVLLANIRGNVGQYKQLYNRVNMAVHFEGITSEDAQGLVTAALPEIGDLWKEFYAVCSRNARRLDKLIKMSKYIAGLNHMKIDKEVILKAVSVLVE